MPSQVDPFIELLKRDKRYKPAAYRFVSDALGYAHNVLELGTERPSEPLPPEIEGTSEEPEPDEERKGRERHLTGQELCEGIRLFALDQYGYLAKCVLNSWGIHATRDFGEIVYNLIKTGKMRKTAEDRIEDFDNVYDFEAGLQGAFQIEKSE